MAKSVPQAIMDAALTEVATSTLMSVVSDESTPANLTNTLANVAMVAGNGNDYTFAEGDAGAGSRKVTMAAKPGVTVTEGGTPRHVVLSLTGTIKMITTCTGPNLTQDSTVDFPAWKYELGIPT